MTENEISNKLGAISYLIDNVFKPSLQILDKVHNEVYEKYFKEQDLNRFIKTREDKFEYGFVGLILVTLALSLQYPHSQSKGWPVLIIISWISFLISALIGGVRIFKTMRIDSESIKRDLRMEKDMYKIKSSFEMSALNIENEFVKLQYTSPENVDNKVIEDLYNKAISDAKESEANIKKINSFKDRSYKEKSKDFSLKGKVKTLFCYQCVFYFLGLILYGVFIIRNFLY